MWERLSKEFTHPVIHGHYSGLLTEASINREICSLILMQKVSLKKQPFDSKELTSADIFSDWNFSKMSLKYFHESSFQRRQIHQEISKWLQEKQVVS